MVDIPQYNPLPGDWFYGSRCPKCGATLPFTLDPDDEEGPHQFAQNPGWIEMTCAQGHTSRHRATELLRLQDQRK